MKRSIQTAAAILTLVSCLPAAGQALWHFEFADGRPVKLVWQTEQGRSYNLRQSDSLVSWSQVPGFPSVATGSSMEYPFEAALRGFFDITLVPAAGGGWQQAQLPALSAGSTFNFSAVSALDASRIWICGNISPGGDACVLRTGDGGLTWSLVYRAGGVGAFGDLQMVTPEIGYVAGSSVRRTFDGGGTWQFEQGNLPNPPGTLHNVGPDGYVYGMSVVDQDHVWTAGYDGYIAGMIHHRVPERPQPDPANPNGNTPWWLEWAVNYRGMYGISAVNSTTAWAVGAAGFIWKTTDGQGWTQQTSNSDVALQDVDAVNADVAWVVGDSGTILKTTDGGTTWIAQTSGTTENLRRVAAVDGSVAWTVGTGGIILHTIDGGTTWTRQFSGTTASLQGLAAVDTNTAWVAGDGGTLLRATDGGTGAWTAPAITGVSPGIVGAYSSPSMTATITGSGFRGGHLGVTFGGTPSESVTWVSESTILATAPYHQAGTFQVAVINEDGQQATVPRAVTFLPSPVITHFSPLHAPATGGYQITVDGFNLQTVDRATFYIQGEPESLAVSVVDSTRVIVTVPESTTRVSGAALLLLETGQNQSSYAQDFLLDPAGGPTFAVTSVTPSSGASQTIVTVTGTGFSSTATLELCGSSITITSRSSTQLVGKVRGTSGLGGLRVSNSDTEVVSVYPAFLLTSGVVPTISLVSPATGPAAGGSSVTITGTGFQTTDTVTFDGYPGDITSRTATSIVVTTPPHAPGPVKVIVMTYDLERSAAVLPDAFTYQ